MSATRLDATGLVPVVELLSRVRNVDVDEFAAAVPDSPLLAALRADLTARLPAVQELVYGNDDYPSYAPDQRRLLMEATALATTIVTVVRAGQGPRRLLPRARRALRAADTDLALRRLAAVVEALGERPVFATTAEFDAWMADEEIFVFDPNRRPVRPE
jgi:hypothetical protein